MHDYGIGGRKKQKKRAKERLSFGGTGAMVLVLVPNVYY